MSNRWVNETVGALIKFEGGSQPPRDTFIFESKEGYVRLLQIRDYKTEKFKTYIPIHLARKFCDERDIMIGRYGPPIFQILRGLSGAYNVALIKAIPDEEKVSKDYVYYFLKQDTLFKLIDSLSQRTSGQTGIDMEALKNYPFPLPPKDEQQKIVSILSYVDKAIEKIEEIIKQTEKIKKGLIQQLLTKGIGHTKFKKTEIGEVPEKWKVARVEEIFQEFRETTNDIETYPLFSLTIERGLTPKTDRYERGFLLKDRENNQYRIVKPNDILFNPMNLRFGAIAISKETVPVCVSAYYNVLKLKEKDCIASYYNYLFGSSLYMGLYERIATGSLVEKKRVHLSQFLQLKIPVPTKEEQEKIVNILSSVERKLGKEKEKHSGLLKIKQGLMQSLLTGKVRVKVDEDEVTQV